MPNRTIYIKLEEIKLWDRAREISAGKIASVVIEALKKYVAEKEEQACKSCGKF